VGRPALTPRRQLSACSSEKVRKAMSALAQAAAIERGVGLLPLQIRRHQEELRRWRQLENHASPAYPRSGGSSGTKNVAAVQRARAASAAPRLESQELQALVMERRELLARQRSQSREHNRRVLQATRALQPAEAEYAYSSGEDLATGGQVADSLVSSGEDDPGGQSSGHPSGPAPRQRSPARRGDGSRQALELQEKMQQLQVEPQTNVPFLAGPQPLPWPPWADPCLRQPLGTSHRAAHGPVGCRGAAVRHGCTRRLLAR
jgi:hypothetical protein